MKKLQKRLEKMLQGYLYFSDLGETQLASYILGHMQGVYDVMKVLRRGGE